MVNKVLRSAEKFSEPFPFFSLPLYPSPIFAFPLRKRRRNKISRFSFVSISLRMVVLARHCSCSLCWRVPSSTVLDNFWRGPNFAPKFPRIVRGLFVLDGDHRKIHRKSTPCFNAKSPGKFKEIIHKSFLESRQINFGVFPGFFGTFPLFSRFVLSSFSAY